ncbi:MAG TPA: GNAT family N-acetyltransferase [Candidatus Acidoferrales bacterium]|nr:GNAT family N-acetyltransferase [Candidatus Acidoferrales bacterium]
MPVRAATPDDRDAIWAILEPTIRAGETYTLPRDLSCDDALAYWFAPAHRVYVYDEGEVLGTYFLHTNANGGGSHVANCGYVTSEKATGRGVARTMCAHSLELAQQLGYRAVQFNFVVATNIRAVRLWESFGFEVVGRLPGAFKHPAEGYVDALVMFKTLASS